MGIGFAKLPSVGRFIFDAWLRLRGFLVIDSWMGWNILCPAAAMGWDCDA